MDARVFPSIVQGLRKVYSPSIAQGGENQAQKTRTSRVQIKVLEGDFTYAQLQLQPYALLLAFDSA